MVSSASESRGGRVRASPGRAVASPSWRSLGLLFGICIYGVLQLRSYVGVLRSTPAIYPDSITYERLAHAPLTGHAFWNEAPWGLPLFYKLLGVLPVALTRSAPIAQWVLSSVAWMVLAFVVASFVGNRVLRLVSLALVLGFSLTPLVSQWNAAILTESLSLSVSVLALAALLLLLRRPTWLNTALALAGVMLSCATRVTNVFWLGVVTLAVAALVLRRRRWIAAVLAAGVVLVFANAALIGNRPDGSVAMNLAVNILPDPAARAYFEQRGLPYTPTLAKTIIDSRYPLGTTASDPRLAPFTAWLDSRGRAAYSMYVVTHPSYSIGQPLGNLPYMLSPPRALPHGLDFFRQPGYRDSLPWLGQILYPAGGRLVIAWILIVSVAATYLGLAGLRRASWMVPAAMLASTVPHAIVVWDADPFAVDRHSLLIGVVARLGCWLLIVFVLDAYLRAARGRVLATATAASAGGVGVTTGAASASLGLLRRASRPPGASPAARLRHRRRRT